MLLLRYNMIETNETIHLMNIMTIIMAQVPSWALVIWWQVGCLSVLVRGLKNKRRIAAGSSPFNNELSLNHVTVHLTILMPLISYVPCQSHNDEGVMLMCGHYIIEQDSLGNFPRMCLSSLYANLSLTTTMVYGSRPFNGLSFITLHYMIV